MSSDRRSDISGSDSMRAQPQAAPRIYCAGATPSSHPHRRTPACAHRTHCPRGRFDTDMSGTIELSEFAVLARDLRVFTAFDASGDGSLDAAELLPALAHLGLVASAEVAARVLAASDLGAISARSRRDLAGGRARARRMGRGQLAIDRSR